MSDDHELDEIERIIDEMQARLVELFDQFRELRIRLGQRDANGSIPIFSKVESTEDHKSPDTSKPTNLSEDVSSTPSPPVPEVTSTHKDDYPADVRVSRLLDPISHELMTDSSPAEVIAEYVQSAKDELISGSAPNDKVARDMDIVLKFLRARGRRSIRPEERENILRRIRRWKAHLSK